MIRHENNDPRRGQREADEKGRQDRITRRLMLAIAVLSTAVVLLLLRSGSLSG